MDDTITYILTTSGFIIPDNDYYEPLKKESLSSNIFNKNLSVIKNASLVEFTKNNEIQHSVMANEYYKKYLAEPTFENFMNMVDLTANVLSKISYSKFFELQANNRNLSFTSFMFCLEIYKGTFLTNHTQYTTIPLSARLVIDSSVTDNVICNNLAKLKQCDSDQTSGVTWSWFLSYLSVDKGAFLTFFKYIFTDPY